MRQHSVVKRLSALAIPVVAAMLSTSSVLAGGYDDEHFWSAKPERQAWVTNYDKCWQSIHGSDELEPCYGGVPDEAAPKDFTVRLNFEFDKYRIENVVSDNELRRLDDYIEKVKNSSVRERISMTGHTDAKGSDAYNYQLGLRRAQAVQDYMISRGIPAEDIISVDSRGKSEMLSGVDIFSVEQRRVRIKAEY